MSAFQPKTGSDLNEIHTPALIVVKDRLERNLKAIHTDVPSHVAVRPHAKAHKSPAIGQMQIKAGACGLCAAKLLEAEVLVEGGCYDVCITNEIVGKANLQRLARLAKINGASISVCVDSVENVKQMANIMRENHVKGLKVLIEVNVGQNRCGVEPGKAVTELGKAIMNQSPWLEFHGLHAYHGSNQHVRRPADRKKTIDELVSPSVKESVAGLEAIGLKCNVITGGGTGSYPFEIKSGLYNEIQPGSYIFMDADYSKNLQEPDMKPGPGIFQPSLFVLGTVVSISSKGWAVIDAGTKAISLDSGPPRIYSHELKPQDSVEYTSGGDEHGILKSRDSTRLEYQVGDIVFLQPGHCDPTVNLYDYFTIVDSREGGAWKVHEVVQVAARGPGL
eukprot:CAMPEP_0184488924 /NCGR_PEP_ID=MMETSP0113_2-20130426/13963_1 /TAXON_ID=91329 /ORGANISM="Norrisiella sphaerica, Strain BC52" /LENGTH=390 /DNA_ID=CAMNT_0026872061 /DNA_START=201 /DNA_END=1373 /DNA_ORIENTATION=+